MKHFKMKNLSLFGLLSWALFFSLPALAGNTIYDGVFSDNTSYEVCFTPGGDCTNEIISIINAAKKQILVQAYGFTSPPIAKALANAAHRGVTVKIILDKSQTSKRYTIASYLTHQGIPVWIDYRPAIAHNKVIITDSSTIITGSFNFTKAAQQKNAENLLVIHDTGLAKKYIDNWNKRQAASINI